jgi:hypothetical protein
MDPLCHAFDLHPELNLIDSILETYVFSVIDMLLL